jgi:hypothetical protein
VGVRCSAAGTTDTFSGLTSVSHEFGSLLLARDFGVHGVWRQIDFAWPSDRAVVNENLSKNFSSRSGTRRN